MKENTHGKEDIDTDEDQFRGLERNLVGKELKKKKTRRSRRSLAAHQTGGLIKDTREGVNELHDRVEAIDELAILVPVFLELIPILLE